MNLLVIGSGGREHAIAWKLRQSEKVKKLLVAPGNAGTAAIAQNLDLSTNDIDGLIKAAKSHRIDLTVVGPEASLAAGIVDRFQEQGILIFGPTKQAAAIESSKIFAKKLMEKYHIPCAKGVPFSALQAAKDYIKRQKLPLVIKADGLAAGKGVTVAFSQDQALQAISDCMERKVFGPAGERVIIEEHLSGREASAFAFTDGKTAVPMVPACDYKRALDGDRGPNTGGMGAYSPPEFFDDRLSDEVIEAILKKAIQAMAQEGRPYKGVLYAGLMITQQGPKVLEFNCRFGDPEAQVTLPRLKTDLLDILWAAANGTLDQIDVEWSSEACVGVVLASGGYPGNYETGFPITGLEELDDDVLAFHAGTKLRYNEGEGGPRVVTAGGRVLNVVATGSSLQEAHKKVYENIPRIRFQGCHYRTDIAALIAKPSPSPIIPARRSSGREEMECQ